MTDAKRPTAGTAVVYGSRSLDSLPEGFVGSLGRIRDQNIRTYVGDSDCGVDKLALDWLRADPCYENVTIFTVGASPRVIPEEPWHVVHVPVDPTLTGRARQTIKDREMCESANWGLALFDPITLNRYGNLQVSSGSLRNTVQLLVAGKPVKFFYTYGGEVLAKVLKSMDELDALVCSYRNEPLTEREASIVLSARGVASQAGAAEVKCSRIRRSLSKIKEEELMFGESLF